MAIGAYAARTSVQRGFSIATASAGALLVIMLVIHNGWFTSAKPKAVSMRQPSGMVLLIEPSSTRQKTHSMLASMGSAPYNALFNPMGRNVRRQSPVPDSALYYYLAIDDSEVVI
jgi:hypothetical protein